MKHALIIGAGRLGKGFIGETLANAEGWKTTFIDIDENVIEAMKNKGYYDVCVHRETRIEEPVSYTHLDVYKRQGVLFVLKKRMRKTHI